MNAVNPVVAAENTKPRVIKTPANAHSQPPVNKQVNHGGFIEERAAFVLSGLEKLTYAPLFNEADLPGKVILPTFHPAYVLRQYTPDIRRKVWDDLCKVMDKLGLQPPKT
ncbi:hypothetical protein LCGC14_1882760 [marine sediment metagenome]|uniref:Uracil-DNA glycosylase-like domain-containing protein n=1 Tax=marine sediment metagenome TaxID=412755 RepID=A0A0F9IFQ3_9ZZZZ